MVALFGKKCDGFLFGRCALPQRRQGMAALRALRRSEDLLEMALHLAAVAVECLQEFGPVGVAHRGGDDLPVGVVDRQGLGLCVLQVLQAVLQVAQEEVGAAQLGHGLRRQQLALFDQVERHQGGAGLQVGFLAAADELEHLGNELDFADAARPQLDVVLHVAPVHFAADLRVQAAHRGKGAEIEIFAEHEWPQDGGQFLVLAAGERRAP